MIENFLILIIICIGYGITQQFPLLPGVEDLRSGYDGMKMLSASEQRSRYRIFDLSDLRVTPYVVKKFNKEHRYAVPTIVQTSDVSTRKENNCESVSYDFQHFYSSYFRSTSFGVGISVGKFSFGLNYHETLKNVFEAITKNSQIVGTSTIWWGMYSIQLPPSFVLKFDPVFNASVNLLITEARNPTTESQQQLYNEFVQNFGTFYVTNVIVGGVAHLYTFVGENYHKTSSYQEITNSISLTAQYKAMSFQAGTQTEQIYQRISETFRKNSDTMSVFQPAVSYVDNQTILDTWMNQASEQPLVINRTVAHIGNLIRGDRQVQEHLRRTVNFYLENGFLPTLAELNAGRLLARHSPALVKPIGPIAGLDVVGCAYNLLTLKTGTCILDVSNFSESEYWTDPYNNTLSYSLPNGFFATNTPESLNLDATVMVTSVEDYYRYTTRVQVWKRRGFFSRKRVERRTTEYYRRFYHDYYNLALRLKQIGWYTLSVSTFPYPKLTTLAERALANLPSTFNVTDLSIWEDFISSFGTHLVTTAHMGGQVWAETWYEKCLNYEHTEVWITEQVRRSFLGIFHRRSDSEDHKRTVDERFRQSSIFSSELLGGTESIPTDKWEEWAPTVKLDPRPIYYRLIPLYELLPEGNLRTALQAAVEYIIDKAEIEDRTYITSLESLRGPPPTVCSRNRVRRSLRNSTNSSQIDYAQIRNILCPYVGYNGLTCAGATGRQGYIPVYRRLPVGVGMSFDITTGTVLLPAIDFTYDNNTYWHDPTTNQTYWSPREVSILGIDETNNRPIARVFPSASELANHWKYSAQRGDWIGGEFGNPKSILDLQQRFFSDDQAIAITQKPHVLYRLKVEVLKLNVYAENAMNALPKVYDKTIYADFIRNWGTHIILRSLIGGMHEQQVLFKDCVFSFNGAITPENLDEYLKQDILAQTLGNSFYAERRKVAVDHRFGGNPSLSNITAWEHSLSTNPALLKIEELIPWYEVVHDPDVKANLQRIIQNQTDIYEQNRIREEAQIMNQRANARMLALKGSIGLLTNDVCEISTQVTLDSTANCSNGCTLDARIKSSSGVRDDRPLWYVRDPATGFVQAQVRMHDGSIVTGARVSVGCSTLLFPSMETKAASICVGCTLINSFHNTCLCVCPAYSTSSTT